MPNEQLSPGYCKSCFDEFQASVKLGADGKCPECDWDVKNWGGYLGTALTIPGALPLAMIGDLTKTSEISRAAMTLLRGGSKVGDQVAVPMAKAALGAALVVGLFKLWDVSNGNRL